MEFPPRFSGPDRTQTTLNFTSNLKLHIQPQTSHPTYIAANSPPPILSHLYLTCSVKPSAREHTYLKPTVKPRYHLFCITLLTRLLARAMLVYAASFTSPRVITPLTALIAKKLTPLQTHSLKTVMTSSATGPQTRRRIWRTLGRNLRRI